MVITSGVAMPKYITKIRRKWYAVLDVPKDLRAIFGVSRLKQTLNTDSQALAELRVLPIIDKWKHELALARDPANSGNQLLDSVVRVRQDAQRLKGEGFDEHDIQWIHEDIAYGRSWDNERGEFVTDDIPLADSVSVVHGTGILLAEHVEEHLESKDSTDKSKDMARSAILGFCKEFALAEDVTERGVEKWIIRTMEQGRKLSYASIVKDMSAIKTYWKWLKRHKSVSVPYPFEDVMPPAPNKSSKASLASEIIGFNVADYHKILVAIPAADTNLRYLVILGAHTGCRIEELCSMRTSEVAFDRFQVVDAKTKAGMRTVPLHDDIKQLVAQLVDTSTDGYLICGESDNNKYKKRSHAAGKRFGRLKTKLGYRRNQVFHSWRHSMTTQLENAERPLSQIQRIIGHTVTGGITFATYSDGLAFETSKEIINLVSWK